MDDTCKTMHGTKAGLEVDKKFLDSARQLHGNNAHFRSANNAFVVKHYAGDVTVRGTLLFSFLLIVFVCFPQVL